jgi:HlyD family secretion protein
MSGAPVRQSLDPPQEQPRVPAPIVVLPQRRSRRWIGWLIVLLLVGGTGWGGWRYRQNRPAVQLPSAPARQGDFLVLIRCRGELKAERSVSVYAPTVPNLRIAWMAAPGQSVKQGDTIVRFDSSSAQQTLMQKEAALKQAQATLDQALAQSKITGEQDQTDLTDAGYKVELARLEASKQEIVSRIQGEAAKVDYGMAQQKLKVQQAVVELHAASDRSRLASLTRQRDQAQSDVEVTKNRIAQMELRAPVSGLLVFQTNYSQGSINSKPYQVGDNVYSGMMLADMPELATLQLEAKIEETDRGRIAVGQRVRVRIDSLPELNLDATVQRISLLAEVGYDVPRIRSFRATAAIRDADPRLRPGMNGGMDIIVNRIPNAISIPAKALFTRGGKPVVYLAEKGHSRAAGVEVLARNPDEIAIGGIPAGAMVTLVDPEAKENKK